MNADELRAVHVHVVVADEDEVTRCHALDRISNTAAGSMVMLHDFARHHECAQFVNSNLGANVCLAVLGGSPADLASTFVRRNPHAAVVLIERETEGAVTLNGRVKHIRREALLRSPDSLLETAREAAKGAQMSIPLEQLLFDKNSRADADTHRIDGHLRRVSGDFATVEVLRDGKVCEFLMPIKYFSRYFVQNGTVRNSAFSVTIAWLRHVCTIEVTSPRGDLTISDTNANSEIDEDLNCILREIERAKPFRESDGPKERSGSKRSRKPRIGRADNSCA